jgi:hypothetical protein
MSYRRPPPIPNNYTLIPKEYRTGAGASTRYKAERELQVSVPFRMAIVGGSDTGKSNGAFEVIKRIDCWGRILIFSGKLESEDLYRTLFGMGEQRGIEVIGSSNLADCPPMEELESDVPTLVILDDMLSEKNLPKQIHQLFEFGRKVGKGVSVIFISQYYYKIPLAIRQSVNYLMLKKIERESDLQRIFADYGVPPPMRLLYKDIVEVEDQRYKHDWFLIDRHGAKSLRYRHNWTPIPVAGTRAEELGSSATATLELVEDTALVPRRRRQL